MHGVSWLESEKELFVIEYEKLKVDIRGIIPKACDFLKLRTNDTVMDCVVKNQEGSYHRPKGDQSDLLVYTKEEANMINEYKIYVQWFLNRRCPSPPACLPRSKVKLNSLPHEMKKIICGYSQNRLMMYFTNTSILLNSCYH